MGELRLFLVLGMVVVCSSARSTRPESPEMPQLLPDIPPELEDKHFVYPIALAEKIVANLSPERLRYFNKVYSVDNKCNPRGNPRCPCRMEIKEVSEAEGEDKKMYILVQTNKYKQEFAIEICTYGDAPNCKPLNSSWIAKCQPEGMMVNATVLPNPKKHYTNKNGVLYLNGTLYTNTDSIIKTVFIPNSKCRCHCHDNTKLLGELSTRYQVTNETENRDDCSLPSTGVAP